MNTWTIRTIVAAALVAGCTSKVGESNRSGADGGSGSGSGSGSGNGPGSGGSGSGGGSGGSTDPTVCIPGIPQTSQLPRLTRAQYDNTIRDLVGISGDHSAMLAPDTPGSVDQRAWDGYQNAATAIADQVMADPNAQAKVFSCAEDSAACARQIISTFGQRAFRRPLSEAEIARFEKLYTDRATITANGTMAEAAALILRAFLLSPTFLTRAEIAEQPEGAYLALNGYEVASRLSYMLWGSMPDDALFAAAAANSLSTPEGILAEAQRMLADPKGRTMVTSFHEHYLHMGAGTRWANIVRDSSVYPTYEPALGTLMNQETERFVDYVVFEGGGTFQDLVTSPVGFVNADLAPLYGLDPAGFGADLTKVDLDPASRSGLFTRLGFLSAFSLANRPSPILRGAFIQKEVLCTAIGSPPPGAESTPLPQMEGLTTNRARVDAQTAGGDCIACHHSYINPTGFAFEAYDAIGRHQTTEPGTDVPIDTTASVILGDETVDVNGAIELSNAIAASPAANKCYARKWVQVAYERSLTNEDSCTVDDLTAKLTAGGYTIINLIADLTQAESFRYRAVPSEVAP
jgi:hypothetical protein